MDSRVEVLVEEYSRESVTRAATALLDDLRVEISSGKISSQELQERLESLVSEIQRQIRRELSPSLRPVVNATGVILYTNAGRAPIKASILDELKPIGRLYSNLEYDLESGARGHRDIHFESRITRLLGCEAATVCNNAAAALLVILNTLAFGKKVLVSRGELIEIGGSFRLPSIMEKSGAILREVGTTNKTRASDFREAVDADTHMILRVHPSNYRIVGFTQRPALEELQAVAREHNIPLIHDLGSGYLFPFDLACLKDEPTVTESLKTADLVCFSGDKLLGGPQAGLILGRSSLVARIRKNPLMRALRLDKLIYAALERTLIEYQRDPGLPEIPIWQFLRLTEEEIRTRAQQVLEALRPKDLLLEIRPGFSVIGGGSAPEQQLPTCLLALTSQTRSANDLEAFLRHRKDPIIARIEDDRVLIDLRAVFPGQDSIIVQALKDLDATVPV